jgi:CRISPR-associated protein Cas1
MPTLYLTEQGSSLRLDGQRLVVEKDDEALLSVPAVHVERVMVFGHAQVTTQAVGFLLESGIDVSYLTLTGKLKGRLVAAESKNVPLRVAQHGRARETAFCLSLAKAIVRGKIRNQRAVVMRYARNHPNAELDKSAADLGRLMERVDEQGSVSALMGVEGSASAVYFRVFGKMLQPEFPFTQRTRRPPRDPVNALLSFGYTLAGNELMAVTSAVGFDPYVGFFHGISYGRPSLPLDLLEEFRAPLVDRLTMAVINLNILEPEDFVNESIGQLVNEVNATQDSALSTQDSGVRFKSDALKRYLKEYEKALNTPFKHPVTGERTSFRRLFLLQAQALAKVVKEGGRYEAYWQK